MNQTMQTIKNSLKLIGQRLAKVNLKNGVPKIYIREGKVNAELKKIGLNPGTRFKTEIHKDLNEIWFVADKFQGYNTVSRRIEKDNTEIGIIDKAGSEVAQALKDCKNVTVTFYIDELTGQGMVKVAGIKTTGQVLNEELDKERKPHASFIDGAIGTSHESTAETKHRPITCFTYCAGVGHSDYCNERAGIKVVGAVEYNPKDGMEDKFAEIYKVNHPETVVYNIPMQLLKAEDLPTVDYWLSTLDCTDYSKLASTKKEFNTMHLYMHMMKLFWQLPVERRPKAILIENVEGFEKFSGNSLKLALEDEGFHVSMKVLDSLEFGSRTRRQRFFLVASIFEGFTFPEPTGRVTTPICEDGVITVDSINWIKPEDKAVLYNYVEREKGVMTHGHKMIKYDITKDAYVGTIPKQHCNFIPENILVHPTLPDTYGFIRKEEHLKYLHGLSKDYYLGENENIMIQSIGQGVDIHVFQRIIDNLYQHLYYNLFEKAEKASVKISETVSSIKEAYEAKFEVIGNQLRFAL